MRYSLLVALILAAGMLIGSGPIGAGGAAFAQTYKSKSQDQIAADTAALKARWYRFGGANAAVGSAGQASNRNGGNRGGDKK